MANNQGFPYYYVDPETGELADVPLNKETDLTVWENFQKYFGKGGKATLKDYDDLANAYPELFNALFEPTVTEQELLQAIKSGEKLPETGYRFKKDLSASALQAEFDAYNISNRTAQPLRDERKANNIQDTLSKVDIGGVRRQTLETPGQPNVHSYGLNTDELIKDPARIYEYAKQAEIMRNAAIESDVNNAAQEQINQIQSGTDEQGVYQRIFGRPPTVEYDADSGQNVIRLSQDELNAILDDFMTQQAPQIQQYSQQTNQLDHITSIFADPMKDMSVASRYDASVGNAYAQSPGSEAYVPIPKAGTTDIQGMLNARGIGASVTNPSQTTIKNLLKGK